MEGEKVGHTVLVDDNTWHFFVYHLIPSLLGAHKTAGLL